MPPPDSVQDAAKPLDLGRDREPASSDLDQLSDAASAPPRSYLRGDIRASTGAENNPGLVPGQSSQISSVTQLFGNFSLRKSRHLSETSVDYSGGDTLFSSYGSLGPYNLMFQRVIADETLHWKSGQLSVNDLFSYTANRGLGSLGGTTPPSILGGSDSFGAIQYGPAYFANVSGASISEVLTKRSSAKFSGAYSITDFLSNNQGLFNSRQVSTQSEYTYQVSRRNKIGVVYGYQDFQFVPAVEALVTNSAQLVFRRRISARMDLVIGAGPQRITTSGISSRSQITSTIHASLKYRARRYDLDFSYDRVVASGAGFYAGGIDDNVVSSVEWKLSRSWQATLSGSYFRVNQVAVAAPGTQLPRSDYWVAGAAVRRRLSRSLSAVASYQFNSYSAGGCGFSQSCNPAVHPNVALIGLDWSSRPVRLE